MVCATSLTKDSFCGSIVSGSPPVLVFSSPFTSAAAALAALLPCPPWQAVTILETATSIPRIDQRPERGWIIRSLQMLWHATRVDADDEDGGRHRDRCGTWAPSASLHWPHASRPLLTAAESRGTASLCGRPPRSVNYATVRPGRSLLPGQAGAGSGEGGLCQLNEARGARADVPPQRSRAAGPNGSTEPPDADVPRQPG